MQNYGGRPHENRKVNKACTFYIEPSHQGLLDQIARATGQSKSRVLQSLIKEVADHMKLKIKDNRSRYR